MVLLCIRAKLIAADTYLAHVLQQINKVSLAIVIIGFSVSDADADRLQQNS